MPRSTGPPNHTSFLARAHSFAIAFGTVYVLFLLSLTHPTVQNNLLYLHNIHWPPNAEFDNPAAYGLAPGKVRNLNLTTEDGVRIGAWHVLPDSLVRPPAKAPTLETFCSAFETHPTILYFHGNAATRAQSTRVLTYSTLSTRLDANILAIDYRGFADSAGTPSEAGLTLDAYAAFTYPVSLGVRPENITLFGQSLGTGVAANLGARLASEGITPRALILAAPFSSIPMLLETYKLFTVLPVLGPLRSIPFAHNLLLKFLRSPFDTLSTLPSITSPILLAHAFNDLDIPSSHSSALFSGALAPLLPPSPSPAPFAPLTPDERAQLDAQRAAREALVRRGEVRGFEGALWGAVEQFERGEKGGRVVFLRAERGGHNELVRGEGFADFVGRFLRGEEVVVG